MHLLNLTGVWVLPYRKKMVSHKKDRVKLTRIFGLASRTPDGTMVLSRSGVLLAPVVRDLAAGYETQDMFTHHPGIKPEEIAVARAWLTRFGADTEHPAALPAGPKALLLDENIPYTLLSQVNAMFGPSSHVEAEGLSRQNLAPHNRVHAKALDTLICRFAVREEFAAIVTQDSDFLTMVRKPDHPVHGLHVFMIQDADAPISAYLERNNLGIQAVLGQRAPGLTVLR